MYTIEADFVEFLAKTGLEGFEAILVLFFDDNDISFFAIVFVLVAFVEFFVDDPFGDFSTILVEFLAVKVFLASSFLELDDLITFLVFLEEVSFDLLSLVIVLFVLEGIAFESTLTFVEFVYATFTCFDATLLPDLACLELTFVAFLDIGFDDLRDSFLVFLSLFLVYTVFADFKDL